MRTNITHSEISKCFDFGFSFLVDKLTRSGNVVSFGSTVDGGVGIPVVLPEHLNSLFSILRENSVQIHMYVYQSLQVRLLSNNWFFWNVPLPHLLFIMPYLLPLMSSLEKRLFVTQLNHFVAL